MWLIKLCNKTSFNRLEKQRDVIKTFDLSLKKQENTVNDLDTEALQKFSAAGSNRHELEKQQDDIMVSSKSTWSIVDIIVSSKNTWLVLVD